MDETTDADIIEILQEALAKSSAKEKKLDHMLRVVEGQLRYLDPKHTGMKAGKIPSFSSMRERVNDVLEETKDEYNTVTDADNDRRLDLITKKWDGGGLDEMEVRELDKLTDKLRIFTDRFEPDMAPGFEKVIKVMSIQPAHASYFWGVNGAGTKALYGVERDGMWQPVMHSSDVIDYHLDPPDDIKYIENLKVCKLYNVSKTELDLAGYIKKRKGPGGAVMRDLFHEFVCENVTATAFTWVWVYDRRIK